MAARLKRIYTALSRYRRSKGFGIHSPFAFHFVLCVLREKAQYYAYSPLTEVRRATAGSLRKTASKQKIPSEKTLRIIFKVTNHFNPQHISVVGTGTGLEATAALLVNKASTATIYKDKRENSPQEWALTKFGERCAIAEFPQDWQNRKITEESTFTLITDIADEQIETVCKILSADNKGVIIFSNMSHNKASYTLWKTLTENSEFGMSFTNGKLGIFVRSSKLPHQHYRLWF